MEPIKRSSVVIRLDTHNVLDYVLGAVLVFSPYIFGFSDIFPARNLFLVMGFALIGYSLLTDYRYSVFKVIPLGAHMALDVVLGLSLIFVPSIVGYRPLLTGFQYAIHLIFGLGAIALVTLTQPKTTRKRLFRSEDIDLRRAA
jgi:hypothetical protein